MIVALIPQDLGRANEQVKETRREVTEEDKNERYVGSDIIGYEEEGWERWRRAEGCIPAMVSCVGEGALRRRWYNMFVTCYTKISKFQKLKIEKFEKS